MAQELMPTDPVAARLLILDAVVAWAKVNDLAELDMVASEERAYFADTGNTHPIDIANKRYIVAQLVYTCDDDEHDDELDHEVYRHVATLEEAQALVEEHVFEKTRQNYANRVRVFDTHTRQELPYETVQTINWTFDKETAGGQANRPDDGGG